jgi:hypothetical protein
MGVQRRGVSSRSRNETVRFPWAAVDEEDAESVGYLGIRIIALLAGLVGIWGLLCLVSGLCHSGGLGRLGTNWISAILGI